MRTPRQVMDRRSRPQAPHVWVSVRNFDAVVAGHLDVLGGASTADANDVRAALDRHGLRSFAHDVPVDIDAMAVLGVGRVDLTGATGGV